MAATKRKSPKDSSKRSERGNSAEALVDRLVRDGFTAAKVGGFDVDGVLRGKYLSLDKLRSCLESGFGFCDVIFGWDSGDALYDNVDVTGWSTGYPDAHAVLDPATLRSIPWEPGVAALLCDFRQPDGAAHPACPRSLLRRVIADAAKRGYEARFGTEFEFFFFKETRDSIRAKGFRGLQPLDLGMFGYSWLRTGQDRDLVRDILTQLREFDVELEALHTETGPGVYEACIAHDTTLRAADKAALFKTAVKQIAHHHGLAVTFMAKPSASLPGASGHLHQSLWKDGKNVFAARGKNESLSPTLRHYVAGQLTLMRELTALYSPTVNSYKRYVPGFWAPVVAAWGVDNRTCAIRVITPESQSSARVEYRQTAADINPYIAMATCLAAGLWGIDERLSLAPETRGEPQLADETRLPTSLADATRALGASRTARKILGKGFVDHYVRTRDWEARQYQKAVTDWELERYFESV